jgi:hypothetical protein
MCEQCNQLRASYQTAVLAYSRAVRQMSGALGNDFTLLMERVEAFQLDCRVAGEELNQHWRVHYAPRDGAK